MVLLLPFVAAAEAQNQIVLNPEFDEDKMISSWSGLEIAWEDEDDADSCHLGAGVSGSVRSTSVPDAAQEGISVASASPADCISVQPGQVVETEIAYRSSFIVGTYAVFYPLANCAGAPDQTQVDSTSDGGPDWQLHHDTFTVPASRLSMQVGWASFDVEKNSVFDALFDRAYVGAVERVSEDDFELHVLCRWSNSVGVETTPPTDPGELVSKTHDGGSAPPPITVSWAPSTDEGGSGLRTYRAGIAGELFEVPCSALESELGLSTQASTGEEVAPGTYYIYVCAEDWAGNQSGVTVGGPYVVD